jgi:hypothetical protein
MRPICPHVCVHVYVCVFVYVCVYVCMCIIEQFESLMKETHLPTYLCVAVDRNRVGTLVHRLWCG